MLTNWIEDSIVCDIVGVVEFGECGSVIYTVSGKNGTTSILGITLTKFNKFS